MPKLVRLYVVSVAIGFALAVVFTALLVVFDVAGLQRLILGSSMGLVAAAMLVMFNGVVFAGVQFAISVMRMADRPADDGPSGGSRTPVPVMVAAPGQARWRKPQQP